MGPHQGPKAPLRFFSKGKIPMPDGSHVAISFVDPESTVCIEEVVHGVKTLVPVHLAGLCEDNSGRAWIGMCRYLDHSTARAKYGIKRLPGDFDRDNELLQCLEVEWVGIEAVKGYSYTLCCTRSEWAQKKFEGALPKGAPVKFSRFVMSTERKCLLGQRTILGDPWMTAGVQYMDMKYLDTPLDARISVKKKSKFRQNSSVSIGSENASMTGSTRSHQSRLSTTSTQHRGPHGHRPSNTSTVRSGTGRSSSRGY